MLYVVSRSWIYYSPTAHGGIWTKTYQVFSDENDPRNSSLFLSASLANQKGDVNLLVLGADRDIWTSDGKTWYDTNAIKRCICDIKAILCNGCQCGGD